METLEAKIKQAILHPEAEVRGTAVRHFSCEFSRDTTVMDWVIRAVQQYGRDGAGRTGSRGGASADGGHGSVADGGVESRVGSGKPRR